MSRLESSLERPHRTLSSREVGRAERLALVLDEVELPDGARHQYRWFRATSAAFIVPVFDDLSTVLVRQWRHPWGQTSWEVPAGTLEEGEDPLQCARRELAEEAGLRATEWTPLGVLRPSALMDSRQHIFLARGLVEVERAPEVYEGDMIVRRLPLAEALAEALGRPEGAPPGWRAGIVHATAVSALVRAGRAAGLL